MLAGSVLFSLSLTFGLGEMVAGGRVFPFPNEQGRNSLRLQAWQAERVSGKSGGDMGLGSMMMNLFLHLLNLR